MKIDIGNGKVLGTKRVSLNGQISGFTEYAGREVLVVLPDEDVDVKLSPQDLLKEVQVAANEHMKVAFHQYKDLKKRFETPEKATKAFMEKHAPATFVGLYSTVESWAKDQLDKVEGKVGERLDRSTKTTTPVRSSTE
ncbi:MAG: hypothetical protein WDA16_08465 [Candidatus Thermoplasmatota archaeon]